MRALSKGLALALVAVLLSVVMPTNTDAQEDIIIIGSKSFTEAEILSWIIYLTLESEGYLVLEDMNTAPNTDGVRQALLDREIDAYVEYTATGVLLLSGENEQVDAAAAYDANTAYTTVLTFDQANNDLNWLQPAPANNTYGLAVTEDFAAENSVETLEDLALYINLGNPVVLAGGSEFFERADAYPTFESTYDWELSDAQKYSIENGQPPETLLALETGEQDTNVAMVYGTTGELLVGEFVFLEDTLNAQPIYQPAPVFRGEIIRNNPEIVGLLNPLFTELDARTLRNLNVSVTRFNKTPREAATDFLVRQGVMDGTEGVTTCQVSRPETGESANLREAPSLSANIQAVLSQGTSVAAIGFTEDSDGFTWYKLQLGPWVREDAVVAAPECEDLNEIQS